MTAPVDQAVETAAKLIYETWKDIPEYRLWQNGGNSLQQDEARRIARQVIELASQQEVAAPVTDAEVEAAIKASGMQLAIPASHQHYRKALESFAASRAPVASPAEPVAKLAGSPFESYVAQVIHAAFADGWGSCRDAEFAGDEAMNDAFNQSATLGVCLSIDQSPTHPVGAGVAGVMDARPDSFHSDSGECDRVQGPGPTDAERTLRRLLCLIYSRGHAYTDDGELSDSRQHPSIDFLRDAPADIEAKMTQRNADTLIAPAQAVLLEHSGCGSNTQVDSLTVRLNPGDKVVLLKGRMTQEFDRADAAILASKGGDQGEGE